MNEVMAIAGSTWRRILRMKVVYFLLLCVFVLIGSAINYDVLSMQEHKPLMIDVSLVLNTLAVALVVIAMTFEIPKELREGVASTLLTKPLGRTQYLVGKYVGTVITAVVISLLVTAGFVVILWISFSESVSPSLLQAHLLVAACSIPMAAIAVLFSIMLPEMITPILTAIALWFSFSTSRIIDNGIGKYLYGSVVPDLDLYNFKSFSMVTAGWPYFAMVVIWGVVFSIFALSLASLIFRFKDIK